MWKNLARYNKLENLHSNDEWTVANLRTGKSSLSFIKFLFYLLLFLVKEKQKSKIVDAQHFEFSIMSPIFNFYCNFCDLMFIYAPFDWSISVTWYIILPVVWLIKLFNAFVSSSTSSSQLLPSFKYLWHISFLSEQFAYRLFTVPYFSVRSSRSSASYH